MLLGSSAAPSSPPAALTTTETQHPALLAATAAAAQAIELGLEPLRRELRELCSRMVDRTESLQERVDAVEQNLGGRIGLLEERLSRILGPAPSLAEPRPQVVVLDGKREMFGVAVCAVESTAPSSVRDSLAASTIRDIIPSPSVSRSSSASSSVRWTSVYPSLYEVADGGHGTSGFDHIQSYPATPPSPIQGLNVQQSSSLRVLHNHSLKAMGWPPPSMEHERANQR